MPAMSTSSPSAAPVPETQGALLARLAAEHGAGQALVVPELGLRWTWAELEQRAVELARGLVALGIEAGERVVVWSGNHPDWIALQFALAKIGAVLVTANTALSEREIAYVLRQSRAAALVLAPGMQGNEFFERFAAVRAELPELRHALALVDRAGQAADELPELPEGLLALEQLVALGRAVPASTIAARSAATRPGDPTNIQYTSGTTGFPKGVVLSHANIVENARTVGDVLAMRASDRLLVQVPLFHCFGCAISVLSCATHASTMVLLTRFDPEVALEALSGERCTLVHGVPTMFAALLDHPRFDELRPETLRSGIMAGTMCPEPLMRRVIEELGCAGMLVAYGLTEASPAITMSAPGDSVEVRCGTVGRVLEGIEVRLVDPASGADVPDVPSVADVLPAPGDAQCGELWARGPNIMLGYFEQPEETAAALSGGWLRTGDLAVRDERGLIRIVGRIKELIIRGGENVYPAEVENALRELPCVHDAAVYGVPSERWGEEVAAALILAEGSAHAELTVEWLRDQLEGRLAHFKCPTQLRIVESFPMTPSGKVQKFRL